jgi:apolipoprotein D and lipocalin family protein
VAFFFWHILRKQIHANKPYTFMKKEKWIIGVAAGAGAAALTYSLLSKKEKPVGLVPVWPFDMKRYLGLWHEVTRLPNIIEKNLRNLTEEYLQDNDGMLQVITKAESTKTGKIKEASGKIKFAGNEDVGMLKVSYLGPFYLDYIVLDVDDDYKYAMVSGSSLNYFWILSRETTIPDDIKTRFIDKAKGIGFAVEKLEWV